MGWIDCHTVGELLTAMGGIPDDTPIRLAGKRPEWRCGLPWIDCRTVGELRVALAGWNRECLLVIDRPRYYGVVRVYPDYPDAPVLACFAPWLDKKER